MTQRRLRLKTYEDDRRYLPQFAEAVGLSCDDETVTLRFMDGSRWGQRAREVHLDKRLAEELSRILNYELDSRLI